MREDTMLQVPVSLEPLGEWPPSGWLPDDELTHEWQQAVEDYRRECDAVDRRRILGDLWLSN